MSAVDIQTFCRIAVALTFALAWLGKIRGIAAFQQAIIGFRLLPEKWSKRATWGFVSIEGIVVLLVGMGQVSGFFLAVGLLIIFSTALAMVLHRHANVTCNCFGWTERRIAPYDLARNMLLILCSLLGIWTSFSPLQNLSGEEAILLGLMALCFVILVMNLADVIETLRRPFHAMTSS